MEGCIQQNVHEEKYSRRNEKTLRIHEYDNQSPLNRIRASNKVGRTSRIEIP